MKQVSFYRNLYSRSFTVKSPKYEINVRHLKSPNHFEIAVYSLPGYELMTDYVPTYINSTEVKNDLRMWLNILNFSKKVA